jgi:hypothetical protein
MLGLRSGANLLSIAQRRVGVCDVPPTFTGSVVLGQKSSMKNSSVFVSIPDRGAISNQLFSDRVLLLEGVLALYTRNDVMLALPVTAKPQRTAEILGAFIKRARMRWGQSEQVLSAGQRQLAQL